MHCLSVYTMFMYTKNILLFSNLYVKKSSYYILPIQYISNNKGDPNVYTNYKR